MGGGNAGLAMSHHLTRRGRSSPRRASAPTRRDFGWIDVPVLDDPGEPIHRRGVTEWPGLGLPWLYTLKSSVLCGAGRDAEYLAEHVASTASAGAPGRA